MPTLNHFRQFRFMPELPEVEVTACQLRSMLSGARLVNCQHSGKSLRHPFPEKAISGLQGSTLLAVWRRAKFLMLEFQAGWIVIHLGMSGSLRCCGPGEPAKLHDHARLRFDSSDSKKQIDLIFHDPRRFGSFQWISSEHTKGWESAAQGLSRAGMGMEPFDSRLTANALYEKARGSNSPVKQWLMNGRAIVGVGNIYASEALFAAGIHPRRKAGSLSLARFERLLVSVRAILRKAIDAGGSTLRDFEQPNGSAGSYREAHQVYGRQGAPCPQCRGPIRKIIQQQRSTFYCHACQR
jgi:formamidopyrimidine-DNA glycosylase